MVFHEVLFPSDISYDGLGGPGFKTTVGELDSGHEQRNIEWDDLRFKYEVAHRVKLQSEYDLIKAFFIARKGRGFPFRYWDPVDHDVTQGLIADSDGVSTTYQIVKRYADPVAPYDRLISKIDVGQHGGLKPGTAVRVFLDGIELLSGFTVDVNTGVITFDAAPYYGESIEATYSFHVASRFNMDLLQASLDHFGVISVSSIPIWEVLDIA